MNKLKELREERKLSRKEVAEELKTTPDIIELVEHGKIKPTYTLLHRYACLFKLTINQLIK
jgi:DNA-binding XRE family transcriptional regulator